MTEFKIYNDSYRRNDPFRPSLINCFRIARKKYFLFIPYWSYETSLNHYLMQFVPLDFETREQAEEYIKKIKEIEEKLK